MKNEILIVGESLNTDKKFFSKIGFNYLIFAISILIFQIIMMILLESVDINMINDFNILTIMSAICNYVLPFPILLYLMKKLESERLEKHSLTIKTFICYIAVSFTLMWAGNIIGLIITALISVTTSTDVANPVLELLNSTDIWLNLLLISIIGPVFEEIFFRKILIDRTIKYGAKLSIFLSALMFGLFHGNLNQFYYTFLIGGFFAYVYIKTGKLIYPILLHIIINLMGSVVSIFVVESAQRMISGPLMTGDLVIAGVYILFILASFLIGLITLSKYKNVKLDHIKTKIKLKKPVETAILNYGMILFIGFCMFEIIYQILA